MTTYSFSRLTSWNTCKGAWNRNYNLNDKGEDNWFSRFGTLAHDIFEKVDRKEIPASEAKNQWLTRYTAEVLLGADSHEVPWMENWCKDAFKFFALFQGWRTEAVWIEEHVEIDRGTFKFQGYVDRLSILPSGDYSMQDYKCSKVYTGETLREKARQMYLYSAAVKERFGVFPKNLIFMHFRQNAPVTIPFKEADYFEAWDWAAKTVAEIEAYEGDYPLTDNGYFCKAICNYRNSCPVASLQP
jgi:RecB family exonuclease